MMTVNPRALEGLPDYMGHDEGGEPLLMIDSDPNHDRNVRASIEADEGIDMSMGHNDVARNAVISSWDFANLNSNTRPFVSGTGSEAGGSSGSDAVVHGSEPSEDSLNGRLEDFDNATPEAGFVDQNIPDCEFEDLDQLLVMKQAAENKQRSYDITADAHDDEFEEPAAEIHVEEGEGLKMD